MTSACRDPGLELQALAVAMLDETVLDGRFVEPRELTDVRAIACLTAMHELRASGQPIDTLTLRAQLDRTSKSVPVEYLLGITSVIPTNPPSVAPRLRELAAARALHASAERAKEACERGDVDEALRLLRAAGEMRHPNANDSEHATLHELIETGAELLHAAAERRTERPALVMTGIRELDEAINGLEYGDLTVIGGDTSVGKSSTALLMALAQSKLGHRPGILSVEDPRPRWARRVIAAVTGVPVEAQRKAALSSWQWEALHAGVERVKGTNVHFKFCVGQNLDAVIAAERTLIRDFGCDVIFLDYIQAIDGVHGAWSRRDEMRIILSKTKAEVNREHPATLVALSQMRKRENEREMPQRADLYEANDIAQKADSIVLLWKDSARLLNGVLDKAKDAETGLQFVIERDSKTGMLTTSTDGAPYSVGGWNR